MKLKAVMLVGIGLIVFLFAFPVSAGVRSCNAALVTAGICTSATDGLLFYSLPTTDPDGGGPRVPVATQIQEGCALMYQYQITVNGSPNPEGKTAFCDRMIKSIVFRMFADFYYHSAADVIRSSTIAATPTDVLP